MADDENVLGDLPEVPADLWERLLTVTFAAPPGDDDLGLLPAEEEDASDAGLDWADVDDADHAVDDHHDLPDHGDPFDAVALDDHDDPFDPGTHDA
jgi:hypothetical protein